MKCIKGNFTPTTNIYNISASIISSLDRHVNMKKPPDLHYGDVIMGPIASQNTSLMIVYSTVYSDANQRNHQSSASLAFVREFTADRWIPRTKGQLRGKCFHLMTSSWMELYLRLAWWVWRHALAKATLKTTLAPDGSIKISEKYLHVRRTRYFRALQSLHMFTGPLFKINFRAIRS